jgi:lipopolysaccharide transport system ATP-binding protein
MINHETQPYLSLRDSIIGLFNNSNKRTKEAFWALNDVTFNIERGEMIGILGKNGAGKSTLLKILSKITPPTSGKIICRGRIASLLEVGTGFHSELSGRENVFMNGSILGMRKSEILKNFDAIVDFAGVEKFIDTPLKHYSSGMQLRLAFAVAAFLENEILIIDEVLAVGDAEFQKKCMGKMEDVSKQDGRTILFVSHNMGALSSLCKKGVFLKNGTVNQIGEIGNVINAYLSKSETNKNISLFPNEIVKKVSIKQNGNILDLEAVYDSQKKIKQPNLGFVIYNSQGVPITGTNPLKSGIKDFGEPKNNGVIRIEMTSPLLADGIYSLSVWFNDGAGNMIFEKPECVTFEINQMGKYFEKNLLLEGNTVPVCSWEFLN